MSMADYPPGGTYPGGVSLSEGQCAEKCVCSALDRGLAGITAVLLQIDGTLREKKDKGCEVVDRCKQEIIDVIDRRFRGAQRTCEACQADAAAGLAGTLDYAIACAGACTTEARRLCPDGSEPPCEEPPRPKVYRGYCNLLTGNYYAAVEGSPTLDPLATAVARSETEEVAFQEAQEYCQKYFHPIATEPDPEPLPATNFIGTFCDIASFYSGNALSGVTSAGAQSFGVAALVKLTKSLSKAEIKGINLENLGELTSGIYEANQNAPPTMAALVLPSMAAALGCTDPQWIKAIEIIAALDIVRDKTGIDLREFSTSIEYAANASCRRKFLGAREATLAYLHSDMEPKTLDAHYAIEGECKDSVAERLAYMQSRPSADQLSSMLHRSIINSSEYYRQMRLNGFVNTQYSTQLFAASTTLLDASTAMALHTDRVLDDSVANKYQLDTSLSEFMAGPLAADLRGGGLTDERIKWLWRGHWREPSVADLSLFHQRSRSDASFGTVDETTANLTDGLSRIGIEPYFHPHYVAAAFEPLTIRLIKPAYSAGVIDDKTLYDLLQQTPLKDDGIGILQREMQTERRKHAIGHIAITKWLEQHNSKASVIAEMTADGYDVPTIEQAMGDAEYKFEASGWAAAYVRGMMTSARLVGYLTAWGVTAVGANAIATKLSFRVTDHQSIRGYIAGSLSRTDAEAQMTRDGLTSESIGNLLDFADDTIAAETATACVAGLRSQYLAGGITEDETRTHMVRFGIAVARANKYISSFNCAKAANGKAVAVEKLCHWLYIGAIGQADFHDRLLRLGYNEADASLLLYDCVQANTLRSIKEANRVAKELQSASDKQRRAVERANAAIESENKRLAQARKAKATLRANRDKQLLSATDRLAKTTGSDINSAMAAVREALRAAQETNGLSVDEALKIVTLASEQMTGLELVAFLPLADQLAAIAAGSGLEPSNADIGLPPSSNGSTHPSGDTTPLA